MSAKAQALVEVPEKESSYGDKDTMSDPRTSSAHTLMVHGDERRGDMTSPDAACRLAGDNDRTWNALLMTVNLS
jgi:hypothetical protein